MMKIAHYLCFAILLVSCDNSSFKSSAVETVDLPPISDFDRIVVQVPLYNPAFSVEITSAERIRELRKFLDSYRADWLVPTFGSYDDETRVELHADGELVDILHVGRNYFAREFGEIHIRHVDKEEIDKLEKILGTGVRTVGHP